MDSKEKKSYIILWVMTVTIIVLGIGGLLFFSYFYTNKTYEYYQVFSEVERSDSNNVTYQYFQKNLLKYSNSGISLINTEGKTLWNGGLDMKQVQVDTSENKVLAADIGGNSFYIYDGTSEGIKTDTTYPIVRAKVSSQGIAADLEQDTDTNSLKLYNPYSNLTKLLAEIPTSVTEDGYPLDFDISPDGTTVVVSYMHVEGTKTKCLVNFYNFSEVGQDAGLLVGGKEYDDDMISQIEFLDKDRAVVYRESGFDIYSNMRRPESVCKTDINGIILSIADSSDHIAVVSSDEAMIEKTVTIFDTDGNILLTKPIRYDYSEMKIYGEEVYFYGKHHADIMRLNGSTKFSADFDTEVDKVFPGGRSVDYLVIDHLSIKKVRMRSRAA